MNDKVRDRLIISLILCNFNSSRLTLIQFASILIYSILLYYCILGINARVRISGISKVELSLEELELVLQTLVYDGRLEEVRQIDRYIYPISFPLLLLNCISFLSFPVSLIYIILPPCIPYFILIKSNVLLLFDTIIQLTYFNYIYLVPGS